MFSNITDCTALLNPVEIWAYQQMEEHSQHRPPSSSSSSNHHEYDDVGPSVSPPSPAPSQLEETEVLFQQDRHQHQQPNSGSRPHNRLLRFSVSHRFGLTVSNFSSTGMRDDVCSGLVILAIFWFFAASMTLILGFYGSYELQMEPNCSYLIEANPVFVHSIQAEQTGVKSAALMLYGFHKSPSRDVKTTWSRNHTASIGPYDHKEWGYHLNAGSQIEISYEVKFPSSAPLPLVIARGSENLHEWIEYPLDPKMVLSWKIIYGSGKISQEIKESDTYYVAVGNLNSEAAMVHLNITIQSVLYNTSDADFQCSLSNYACSFKLHLLKPNAAVLTSPGAGQVKGDDGWYIKVSFGPRWLTYLGGFCTMTSFILCLFIVSNILHPNSGGQAGNRTGVGEREQLLSPKSNDGLSDGSSYDSISNDGDDLEDKILDGFEGKVPKEGEANGNPRRLCVICYDAPRECFFLPCGHCATCFSCGTRVAEEAGICPICRRKMKKVRKIFPV